MTTQSVDLRPGPADRLSPGSGRSRSEILSVIAADARRRRDEGGGEPPLAALELLREERIGAVRVPVELGGAGYSLRDLFDLIIDLAEADPDVPHILRVHFAFVEELFRVPTTEKKQRWLGEVLAGSLFGGANSELSSRAVGKYEFDTTLTPDGDGYRLNGTKFYSTGTVFSDYVRVTAGVPDGTVLSAVVPTRREGVEHLDDWDGIGQRHTGSGTTVFTDVRVAEDETFPFRLAGDTLRARQSFPQLVLHAVAAGILRSVATDAAELVRSRRRSFAFATVSEPRHDPQLLEIIGSLTATAFAAESIVRAAAEAQDEATAAARTTGIDPALEARASILAAKAKVAIEEPALRAASRLFDVGGASATRQSAHLDRHWRNLRTLFAHNPTAYKARVLGDLFVNDTPLPDTGFF
ncbi:MULTISPECIES: acyl-CoA dehydrogenase family protein [Rhodococcus]|uniref:Acyl-CoA dehydrogenase n=1 Tax=Rhodococcus rhodochrous TaxID=1829 RepID=A0AA46WYF1_RHORH|nr:acyl-CoA dehydrogenase family protein [Rhodococcus rhodochrous]UZF46693.1 acyl-CoA dehydrogenase [Rhodococcus rhodochrous]